jgi:hypothetical protein
MPTLGALETVVPTERESLLAEESSSELSSYLRNTEEQTIRLLPEGGRWRKALRSLRRHFVCWLTP